MWRGNFCGRRSWSEESEALAVMDGGRVGAKRREILRCAQDDELKNAREKLFGFLHGFEVGFEGGAVLFLGFELGLEFFHQKLEAADFVA
jgi:hypothetical protein